jgi:muramoyltetrapeptide carboxypeptidase
MFKPLRSNATIGIISPAWIPDMDRLAAGIRYLEGKGYKIKEGWHLGKIHGYFAGTDLERLSDLHDMYSDPAVELILCARGGWGGLRMVDKIDYDLIMKNKKPLIGYSDITTLQLAIWARTMIPSFSGPMAGVEMGIGILPFTEQHFWRQIKNNSSEYKFLFGETKTSVMVPGIAKGVLLGGCLSLVCHSLGTIYSPDYEGAILFLEDVGEKPYKIDRYLAHLKQAGVFERLNGLILGDFIECNPEEDKLSFTVTEILQSYFSDSSYPVLFNFPYGHGELKFTMPIGVRTRLDTSQKEICFANPFHLKTV